MKEGVLVNNCNFEDQAYFSRKQFAQAKEART
jgi:hypothetical protein